MFKVIVAGGRDFKNRALLFYSLDKLLVNYVLDEVEIVSGGAKGADELGEIYSNVRGTKLSIFPADWDKHGKAAGPIRNKEMAKYADSLVAFWDGKSKGTKNMIDEIKALQKPLRVVRYSSELLLVRRKYENN